MQKAQLWVLRTTFIALMVHIGLAALAAQGVTPPSLVPPTDISLALAQARFEEQLKGTIERVEILERNNAAARLSVLESDMTEVKWLSRGVTMAVVGQFVATLMGLRQGKK